ncbi:MAG TPA: hypothetical protein VND89_04620 [Acidimicrobiales bacterium]|nr:hypothetical protein [Acidimicrobiales bacterium]
MIDPRFIYLALTLSAFGGGLYVRDTLRGVTSPNRVTWSLWGLEGVLAFAIERQQHVGLASWMTLMFGLVPVVVVTASFRNPKSVWKIGPFDIFCGLISLAGLALWAFVNEPTLALVSFVSADQIAALPTLRKSWLAPSTESPVAFLMGTLNCAITILTLKIFSSAGVLFPGCVATTDFILTIVIITKIGPRFRGEFIASTKAHVYRRT